MSGPLLWAAVAGAGGFGAIARVLVGGAIARRGGAPHLGTLGVNLLAALLAGAVAGAGVAGAGRWVVAVGLLGSFSTLSTALAETRALALAGRRGAAAGLVAATLVGGLAAAGLGWAVSARLPGALP
ncbi:MAG TPA: CrcB family protein [Miltoncostaeaceae bacterium]|nr:CrcB family protein [Miltoncostaeaceae bacterium]